MYQQAHYPEKPASRSLPRWALWAFAPVALALGLIVGVAASAYGPWVAAPEPVSVEPPSEKEPQAPADDPASPAQTPGTEGSDPTAPDTASLSAIAGAALLPPPADDSTYAAQVPRTAGPELAEVRTLVDARTVLASEFAAFTAGGRQWFQVDYQVTRDINYDTMLVGIIKIAEYNNWVTAVRDYRDELTRWLTAAARRVRDAALNEGFNLSWALFEVVPDKPFGFLASEVTPLPRGQGYLVTRPLAGVTDFSGPTIAFAAVISPEAGPVNNPGPATVYGPVLRFNPTDLYRPPAAP